MVSAALPQPATSFVGRARELHELRASLARGERFIALTGLGGIGKSRLALACAGEQLRDGVFDRASFIALETEREPQAVPTRLAGAIGADIQGAADPWEALATAIGDERWLLVLDNLDELAEIGSSLLRLLTSCPYLSIVTTSREPLGVTGAWTYTLGGLAVPAEGGASAASEDGDAVRLFAQRAKRADVRFQITPENVAAVAETCRLVDGMPLAIELAASWLRMMPLDEIAHEIRSGIDLLTSTSRNVPERHRSMRAVLDHSWQLSSPEERDALTARATFEGGFTRDADAAVAEPANDTLASLVGRSLLRLEAGERFGFHRLVHQYAAERLAARPDLRAEVERRHGAYYLAYVAASLGRDDEVARLDAEIANVLAAMQRAAARDDRAMLVGYMRLLAVDGAYFGARGHTERSLGLLEAAIRAAKASGELLAAHGFLAKLGNQHKLHRGDLEPALVAYREALELAEQLHDHHREVVSLSVLGQLRFEMGAEDADAYLERAYDMAARNGDALGLNHVLQHQGIIAGTVGDWGASQARFQEAAEALDRIPQPPGGWPVQVSYQLFMTLLNLGEAERMLGRLDRSLELRRRALAMAEVGDNDLWRAYALQELGEVLHGLGDAAGANDHYERALALWIRHGVTAKVRQLRAVMAEAGAPGR
jgi:predicted ATPase